MVLYTAPDFGRWELEVFGQDVTSAASLALRGMVVTRGNDRLSGDGTSETSTSTDTPVFKDRRNDEWRMDA